MGAAAAPDAAAAAHAPLLTRVARVTTEGEVA